jgi:acetyl esterase
VRPEHRATYGHTEGYVLDGPTIDFFFEQASGSLDPADPLVSPLLAERDVLAAAPPALVVTAEYDPLLADGRGYAEALRAAGVSVDELYFDDQMHLFFSLPELLDGARTAIERAGEFLAEAFTRA